jgi:hypothetical protein
VAGAVADRYGLTAPLLIQSGCALTGAFLALALEGDCAEPRGHHRRVTTCGLTPGADDAGMSVTVREAVFALLRDLGLNTIFGMQDHG